MPITADTPTTEITKSTHRRRGALHRRTTAGVLALAFTAVAIPAAPGTAANAPARTSGLCTLTPATNSATVDPTSLVMTVRSANGVSEMLHEAHCTDGRVGFVWIAANIIR